MKHELVEYLPKIAMKRLNQRRYITKFNINKELLEAAI